MLKIKNIEFFKSFANHKDIPNTQNVEICFVGRSNVGKSSLLNDLANRKISLTSSTPGKTQLINFFLVNGKFYFVDLPGYGYAKVPKSMKRDWNEFIVGYLENREQMKVIFFLLDIRRTPNEQDKTLNEWFKTIENVKVFYILTKADKLSSNEVQKQKTLISLELFVSKENLIVYSVPKKIGKIDLLKRLEEFIKD
ncbi:MAG TPA: ribosome biogenesis GTP-binding protein YihA/YsxC [Spirochaetota bacterium]|nr:ribosome biogenesis GTP-binding protein YihA/YsxC [Spirochaetota bacterium]